jgi:transcriptional regulator with XRE-family HTH domain
LSVRNTPEKVRPKRHPVVGVLAVRGISRKALAETVGVSPTFLRLALNGQSPISPRLRAEIAKALRLPEEKLFHNRPAVRP